MKSRRLFALIHRYTGLLLVLPVLIACLTGIPLAFAPEIDRWLNPTLLTVTPPSPAAPRRSLEEQLAAASGFVARLPDGSAWQAAFITPGLTPEASTAILFRRPGESPDQRFLWRQVLVDPYSLAVLGDRERSRGAFDRPGLMRWLGELHGRLRMDESGRWIMGIAALVWCLTSLVGLVLWWPGLGKLRLALTIKTSAGSRRLNFDLHRALAFYSLPILFVVSGTGIYLALPATVKPLVGAMAPLAQETRPQVQPRQGPAHLTPDQAVARARQVFPMGDFRRLGLPLSPREPYSVAFRLPDEVQRPGPGRSLVWIDPTTGAPLGHKDATRQPAGDTFLAWQTPLHTGFAFGQPGRWIVAAAGLIGAILTLSGTLIWWSRGRRRPTREGKPSRAIKTRRPVESAP